MKKQKQPKNNSKKIKFKYKLNLNKIKSKITLLHEFLKVTKLTDFKEWELNEDKNLYTILTEYLLSNLTKYLWIGFILNVMMYGYSKFSISILNILTLSITYWLLTDLLLMMFKNKVR